MPEWEVTEALNRAIAICRDDIALYEQARDRTDDSALADLFRNMVQIRAETIDELAPYVEACDGSVSQNGTLEGAVQRMLAQLHARLTPEETKALVAHLEKAEGRTVQELQEIAGLRNLPEQVAGVLLRRIEVFRSTYTQIHTLHRSLGGQ